MAQAVESVGGVPQTRGQAFERPRVPATIIPLAGLPIVVAVIGGMIAAIATNTLWALDFYHVVGGGLWTAIDLFVGLVIGPIMGSLPTAARAAFSARFMPKMSLIMPTLVTMTLGAGWQLARHLGNLQAGGAKHGWLVASYAVVGVMAVIALGLLEPANIAVLFEMRKERPDPAVIERLMRRFIYTAGITGLMQVATLIIMTRLATI
ncbi:MAG TPA: hypothetical protein VKU89_02545 [Solirubrobacteraceae bacterium]|nr:hypothetical protein [Solirubrobacteraceae bacterium]